MTTRAAFLDNLRSRLAGGTPVSIPHPPAAVEGVSLVEYADPLDRPVDAFIRSAEALSVHVRRCADGGELAAVVAECIAATAARTAVLSNDPEVAGLAGVIVGAGASVVPFALGDELEQVDLGVVGARWGVAATGSLVVDAARAGGRSASLVPGALLVVVRAANIVATAGDLFRGPLPIDMPSQLVFISGPSRSGDIEFVLTVGVHGPGVVWVATLD